LSELTTGFAFEYKRIFVTELHSSNSWRGHPRRMRG